LTAADNIAIKAKVEFGAKIDVSITNGFSFLEESGGMPTMKGLP